jgi:hypothetical protein
VLPNRSLPKTNPSHNLLHSWSHNPIAMLHRSSHKWAAILLLRYECKSLSHPSQNEEDIKLWEENNNVLMQSEDCC